MAQAVLRWKATSALSPMIASDPSIPPPDLEEELGRALDHFRAGRLDAAEALCRRVQTVQPDHFQALRLTARIAGVRGDLTTAIAALSRAAKLAPHDVGVWAELGVTYRAAERYDAARYVLERALLADGGSNPFLRLLLAEVLERDARPELALLQYFRALLEARRIRRWAQPGIDTFGAEQWIPHAEAYVRRGRRDWFERLLAAQRDRRPAARWDRIDGALAIHLGERPPPAADAAVVWYVPELDSGPFPDPHGRIRPRAPDLAGLRAECDACLRTAAPSAGVRRVALLLRGLEQYEVRHHAPRLRAALAALPLLCVPNCAPEVELIELTAKARARLPSGRSNARCHLVLNGGEIPIVVVAGDRSHQLAAGESLVVDPRFPAECWAEAATRVLLGEVWHPALEAHEREALSTLFAAAVDFAARLQELP
jgi:Tfp pilus assembly protein PilF